MKIMSKARKLYRNERIIYEHYYDSTLCFGFQLSTDLKDSVAE